MIYGEQEQVRGSHYTHSLIVLIRTIFHPIDAAGMSLSFSERIQIKINSTFDAHPEN